MSPQTSIAHYRILSKIGEGGMGAVYRATDTKLSRQVAIKVLPDSFADDPDRLARFTREAQVLASLNHPHIAAIYGVEERALVMELVEGDTLADRIARGAVPVEEAVEIARQIADALEYAHEKGVIHRDLKPANIKVTPDGKVKVLDFGLAKALTPEVAMADTAASPTMTMRATLAGVILGTAAYMSPEQAKGKPVDRRADIWTFGVVLAELLMGGAMYSGETASETLAAVIMKDPDLSKLPAGTPAKVRRLLQRCLEKDPRRRLRDIGEARLALEAAEPDKENPPAAATPRARVILPWALAATLAAALTGSWWLRFREAPAQTPVMRFAVPPPGNLPYSSFALSPDGTTVVFTTGVGGSPLWIRPIDSLIVRQLPATEGARQPFWAPDSRSIAFAQTGLLKRIDVRGGPPQTICSVGSFRGGSWSKEGTILYSLLAGGIYSVPATGGAGKLVVPVSQAAKEVYLSWPGFLPDGRRFLVTSVSSDRSASGVYLTSLGSTERHRILPDESSAIYVPLSGSTGHVIFSRDGSLMAVAFDAASGQLTGEPVVVGTGVPSTGFADWARYSASSTGTLAYVTGASDSLRLYFRDRNGKRLEPGMDRDLVGSPRFSRDGRRVAVASLRSSPGELFLIDVATTRSSRLTFNNASNVFPVWSHDDRQIVYASSATGTYQLMRKSSDGKGGEVELLRSDVNKYPSDISPDGKYLLYTQLTAANNLDLMVLPLDGAERTPAAFLNTGAAEQNGRFSPDGKWIVYTSDESSAPEVYVRPFSPPGQPAVGGQWQISRGGGMYPQWAAHGKELFYIDAEGNVVVVSVATAAKVEFGPPQSLMSVMAGGATLRFSVSPDGQRIVSPEPENQGPPAAATIVVNWQKALKQ